MSGAGDRSRSAPEGSSAAEEAARITGFARALFARGGEGYAAELGEKDRSALVDGVYRYFAHQTAPVRCRFRNPTLAADGWESPYSVFESHLGDRPFVVDTIREFLHECGLAVRHFLHPIFCVERDPQGRLVALRTLAENGRRESFVHCVVDRLPDAELAPLERELALRLEDVVLATDDYAAMRERLEEAIRRLAWHRVSFPPRAAALEESVAFLRWLGAGGFVLLGVRSWRFSPEGVEAENDSGLGLLRESCPRHHPADPSPQPSGALVSVRRSPAESTVHRIARLDLVAVQRLDDDGQAIGEEHFLGLFTSTAYADESAEVPILREKLGAILAAEGLLPDSHDYKEVISIFNSLPKLDLFELSVEELCADVRAILAMGRASAVRLSLRADAARGRVSAVLAVPRDHYSADVRRAVQALLEEHFAGTVVDTQLALGEGEQARVHFTLACASPSVPEGAVVELERAIAERVRTWDDRLRERLLAKHRGARGRELAARYQAFFSAEYKASTEIPEALSDLANFEALDDTTTALIDLVNPVGGEAERFSTLKVYRRGEPLVLSDFLPVLENLGLRVFAEDTVTLGEGDGRIRLHRFRVLTGHGQRLDARRTLPLLAPAILDLLAGRLENDALNRLIVDAGLEARAVDCLRTYHNAAFQLGVAGCRKALGDALLRSPEAACALFAVFTARFSPTAEEGRAAVVEEARSRLLKAIESVETSADDRVLRSLLALVETTLRTTFYRPPRADHPSIAIKIDSQALDFCPKPRPRYEVHVHSARMEGVHLRGGKVARGGIRLSDRPDDFRTEVLGLMKTQMVKNALIVPVGAKGGFVVKRPRAGEEGVAEVRACYTTLMRGLLELSDNVVQGVVTPPAGAVRYDDDDPYLVVAADKGTATFSDLANSVAEEQGFWLGDAFASGGSAGYDHKKEGITARGAWELIRRHLRELGRDVDHDPVTVVGIGDMSGDVFGNAMLLSRHIRLRAAFNHLHVFLDPEPDPDVSFRERERLFRLPRSSWTDYDPKALSPGGLVVARTAKTVKLSAAVRQLLGIETERLDGEGLVRAILRTETDLLFNGGVGTYVRASTETNAEAGDSSNDAVRVIASELRAKVVGEGGNLGLTQRARIELAVRGGRVDTDAVHNSGGVDLSDHEVNLKILFRPLLESGALTVAQRNRLLEQVKEEVILHVLEHNARQHLLLSLDELRSRTRLVEFRDLITDFEQEGFLDRALECLPDRETLQRRAASPGLVRPELAVVAAYAKLWLQRQLQTSPWLDDPAFERWLFAYFPAAIGERFDAAVRGHRLRREIVSMEVGNQVIDRMGATFAQRLARDTGTGAATAVAAWAVVVGLSDADRLFDALAASALPAEELHRLCLRWERAVEAAVKFVAGRLQRPGDVAARIAAWKRPVAAAADLASVGGAEMESEVARLEGIGLAPGLARSIVALSSLRPALEVVRIAEEEGAPLELAASAYRGVEGLLDFPSLERWFEGVPGDDRWEKRAAEGLREDVAAALRRMTRRVLRVGETDVAARLAAFAGENDTELARLRAVSEALRGPKRLPMAAVVVLVREIWKLAGRE